MICHNNYLFDILRVLRNKGFNLGDAFSKSLSINRIAFAAQTGIVSINRQEILDYPSFKETKSAPMNIFRFFFIFFLNHL